MAKVRIEWDDSETEKIMETLDRFNSLGETLAQLEKTIKKLNKDIKSKMPESNPITVQNIRC
jgi:hypothetical protein